MESSSRGGRSRGLWGVRTRVGACLGSLLLAAAPAAAPQELAPEALLTRAMEAACAGAEVAAIAAALGAAAQPAEPILFRGRSIGWRLDLERADGARVRVERFEPGGRLRRVTAEYGVRSGEQLRPVLLALSAADCRVREGRRIRYDGSGRAVELETLGGDLAEVVAREPLNPPVPAGDDPGGVAVAMVDSGVNYLLPALAARLARDGEGGILGYDWWDLDERPFDAHPVRSPFLVQRHGTRTASVVVREAPVARLVPYRYPRPAMERMAGLVDDAAAKRVRIVNLSLGSDDEADWRALAAAMARHPEILFVASAGNNGRDIDRQPVYPAALDAANLLVVTSADASGRLAAGSNWGRRSVDVMIGAEEVVVTDFDGSARLAAGSSFAAPRVTALATCLAAAHPDWRAQELKRAIVQRAAHGADSTLTAHGLIPDPLAEARGACAPEPAGIALRSARTLDLPTVGSAPRTDEPRYEMRLSLALLAGTSWSEEQAATIAQAVAELLAQCAIRASSAQLVTIEAPERYRYLWAPWSEELVREAKLAKPAVFFVADTLRSPAFEAEAFGLANTGKHAALAGSVWITAGIADPGISAAHEVVHVLTDSGAHSEEASNLMRERTSPEHRTLTPEQCREVVANGTANGYLRPVE